MKNFNAVRDLIRTVVNANTSWGRKDFQERVLRDIGDCRAITMRVAKDGEFRIYMDHDAEGRISQSYSLHHSNPEVFEEYQLGLSAIIGTTVVSGHLSTGNVIEKCNLSLVPMLLGEELVYFFWKEYSVSAICRNGKSYSLTIDNPV